MIMPVYKVTTTCMILADDIENAKLGFAQYVGGDLGLESIDAVQEMSDEEVLKNVRDGYDDPFDYSEGCDDLLEEIEEIRDE